MISALSWVPKGAAKAIPDRAKLPSKEEIEKLEESCEFYSEDEEEETDDEEENGDVAHAKAIAKEFGKSSKSKNASSSSSSMEVDEVADGLKELDMDNYDEEDDAPGLGIFITPVMRWIHISRTIYDIYVCEETSNGSPNIYSHQEILLPKPPMCTAWLDCPLKGGEKGNFVAVGLFKTHAIEIWDLDIMRELLPCVQLGGKKKGVSSLYFGLVATRNVFVNLLSRLLSKKYREGSHTKSVIGLAWNKEFRNILASGSVDKQVKVWDVATETCQITLEHHTKGVQAVAWNHYAPEVLLSGSFDRTVVLKDVRKPSHSGFKWSVISKVESLAWDPHSEYSFLVSLKDGTVKGFDVRQASTSTSDSNPSFTLQHGRKAVTSISYNVSAPNLLATGSTDQSVKLWDLSNNEPSCIATHRPNAGRLFSIAFSTDNPFLLAMGGLMGKLKVWDILSDTNVSSRYGSRQVRP
ncbi:hypothetical protein ARALYDRAFT_914780 [Arabidopsis lyrata subsp. lyrata]|uniref:Uncharacterized protein n=1 Tax=Arabidopsis lyrata subsp. lyrata TaxID=81972 RepID=D7M9D6_ARALL|nr:hypothetical protein ARALYDRAFT_914780 [Arabidopsis lyrata subsp. lyrata]